MAAATGNGVLEMTAANHVLRPNKDDIQTIFCNAFQNNWSHNVINQTYKKLCSAYNYHQSVQTVIWTRETYTITFHLT